MIAKFSAFVLGTTWLILSFSLLIGAGILISLLLLPCSTGGVDCSTAVTHTLLFDTFAQTSVLRALQVLGIALALFGIAAFVAAATMISYALFRGQQHAVALGMGFGILVIAIGLLTLSGVGGARHWNDWVRRGCQITFIPEGQTTATTEYRCAGFPAETDPAPYTFNANLYDNVLDTFWTFTIVVLAISVSFTPLLLTAPTQPPTYLMRRFRRANVCAECGHVSGDGEIPSCVLCRIPQNFSAKTAEDVYNYEPDLLTTVQVRLDANDRSNPTIPLRRVQLQIDLPSHLEFVRVDQMGWSIDGHRRGRRVRINSPIAFLPASAAGAAGEAQTSSVLTLYFKARSGVRRQFRSVRRYPVKLMLVPLDGLTRRAATQVVEINIRRPAWMRQKGTS